MFRFFLGVLVVCSASLLALQVFVSLDVNASSHSATINSTPTTWYNNDFLVSYSITGGDTCELWTRDQSHSNAAMQAWGKRADVSCSSTSQNIQVPAWCESTGAGACEVRVVVKPPGVPKTEIFGDQSAEVSVVNNWSVPPGVTSIDITVRGAQGANGGPNPVLGGLSAAGGRGGEVTTTNIPVTGGEVFDISVGATGNLHVGGWPDGGQGVPCGFNCPDYWSGGGGGSSEVSKSGISLIVAGGGGGGGGPASSVTQSGNGGAGGGPNGGDGGIGQPWFDPGGNAGGGATQVSGGLGGAMIVLNPAPGVIIPFPSTAGTDGTAVSGGSGGTRGSDGSGAGGGGGGGLFGGGGGGATSGGAGGGGGGGGSSWSSLAAPTYQAGVQPGNGQVIINYIEPVAPPVQAEQSFDIDRASPEAEITDPGPGFQYTGNFNITYRCEDADSGINTCWLQTKDNFSDPTWTFRKNIPTGNGLQTQINTAWCPNNICILQIGAADKALPTGAQNFSAITWFNAQASVSIVPSATWWNQDFQVQYSTQSASSCDLETRNGLTGAWIPRGPIPCGVNQSTPVPGIRVPEWCSVEGVGECGVRVTANPTLITAFDESTPGSFIPWTVPAGVTEIIVEAWGAEGGAADIFGLITPGGQGGYIKTTIPVTPGENLRVYVGGKGVFTPGFGSPSGGFNGGGDVLRQGSGGGGATDIRRSPYGLNDRIVVAGGGGGAGGAIFNPGSTSGSGGDGGGITANNGSLGHYFNGCNCSDGENAIIETSGGQGGAQNPPPAGGIRGIPTIWECSSRSISTPSTDGSFGIGGNGGIDDNNNTGNDYSGGGGGGGWYGGGGGGPVGDYGCTNGGSTGGGGGGGGGSSYSVAPAAHTIGVQSGNGRVVIKYASVASIPNQAIENFSIDLTAPVINTFTATDTTSMVQVDVNTDPLQATSPVILEWTGQDNESGIDRYEVQRAPDVGGVPGLYTTINSSAGSPEINTPPTGIWWYRVRAIDNAEPPGNCISSNGTHCGGVTLDAQDPRVVVGPIQVVFNQPPVVNAGPDQTVPFGLPTVSVTLSGTATDDGFPNPPGAITTQWTKAFGPGNVTFSSPTALTTTVTFDASGIYSLQLNADDGSATSFDPIQIDVQNNQPFVDAGPAVINLPFAFPLSINGVVTDDNLPNLPATLTISWQHVSGPGNAVFSNPFAPITDIQFSQAGTHHVRLTASDGEKTAVGDVIIHYGAPARFGLVPCGVVIDDPSTPYDETADCETRHTFLLLRNVIDFALWKLIPIIIAIMVVLTGVLFYFQLGSANTLVLAKRIWRYIGIGVVVLIASWLFLNFFLGVLGFDINVFGQWTSIQLGN